MTAALEVIGLRVQGTGLDTPLVDDLNLSLPIGGRLTILGESGSGKSLLAQAVMGVLPAGLRARGDIVIGGRRFAVQDQANGARAALWGRQLAMLPQEPWLSLDPCMRARQQVAEVGWHLHGLSWPAAQRQADAALQELRLGDAGHKYPHQISGGMAQRVAMAAVRAAGAGLLLADEPTKGLDAGLRDQVARLLLDESNAGRTLITITHDVTLARQLGGEVAIMLDGRVIEYGPADQVLEAPAQAYSRELIGSEPTRWPRLAGPLAADAAVVVQAEGIGKSYGAMRLFDRVDLNVRSGEIVAVTGPSGCGKTTLGHVLLGLTRPDRGRVSWPGVNRPHALHKLYQDPPSAFSPHRRLRDSLADLVRLHHLDTADVGRHMPALKLGEHLLDRLPGEVSGGELQRIALLRVLLLRPAFLFADEPSSRLDPITQQRTLELMCRMAGEWGFGLMLVTHDIALAQKAAHRIQPVAFGPTETA